MRVVFDTELPSGTSHNYRKSDAETASEPAASLLKVDGINGIYHVMNFMAIEKDPDVEWDEILAKRRSDHSEEIRGRTIEDCYS